MHGDHPTKLKVSIGGYLGPSCCVQLQGDGDLVYESSRRGHVPEERLVVSPSASQWSRFWPELERAGVWNWRRRYLDPDVCDGTQWGVEIEHAGRTIKAFGSNRYPKADGSSGRGHECTECFQGFCQAVSRLVGGRPFH